MSRGSSLRRVSNGQPARAEAGLQARERQYRELLDGLGVAVYTTDAAGRITFFNEAAVALWGREPELGKDLWCGSWRLYWPDGTPMSHDECPMAIALTENRAVTGFEVAAERPDGTRVSFIPYPTPLHDASGALTGALNVMVDITERKEAEDKLRASENRINLAMEAGGMGAWEWNVSTGEVHWSEGLEIIHGVAPGIFDGTFNAFLEDVHPADRSKVIAQTQASLKTGTHDVEYRIIQPDGEVRWVVGKGQCMYDAYGQPTAVLGVCMDITERKRSADRDSFLGNAATTLAASLDYDTVLAQLANLIVGDIADWCAIDILEADGSIRRLVLAHADPTKEDVARQLEHYVPSSDRAREVVELLRRGTPMLFPELTAEQVAAASLDESQAEVVRDLGVRSAMIVPLFARGELLGAITFVFAESGRRYGPADLALAKDLAFRAALAVENARLYRESQRVQEELRQANEAKDEFLGLVSHELRTPITTIYGGARLLRSRSNSLDEESRQAILADISNESERLRRVVENMLVLARAELGQDVTSEPILLQHIIQNAVKTYAARTPSRSIECKIEGTPRPAAAEATYVEQVLRNLLSNAEKYSPPETPIEVIVETGSDEVIVRVLDEGPGIQPEEVDNIFDRFYRSPDSQTKAKGVGLGLTVCKRLIEAQSGRVWAQVRETGGLEVGFALPFFSEVKSDEN